MRQQEQDRELIEALIRMLHWYLEIMTLHEIP